MATDFLGFRLNDKRPGHKEIMDWMGRFKKDDKSDEARRLLLLGIRVSRGELRMPEAKPSGPIKWEMPTTPTVKEKVEKSSVITNILQSFG